MHCLQETGGARLAATDLSGQLPPVAPGDIISLEVRAIQKPLVLVRETKAARLAATDRSCQLPSVRLEDVIALEAKYHIVTTSSDFTSS